MGLSALPSTGDISSESTLGFDIMAFMMEMRHDWFMRFALIAGVILLMYPTVLSVCSTMYTSGIQERGPICLEHQASSPLQTLREGARETLSILPQVDMGLFVFFNAIVLVFLLVRRVSFFIRDRNRRLQWVWKRAWPFATMHGSPPYVLALHDR